MKQYIRIFIYSLLFIPFLFNEPVKAQVMEYSGNFTATSTYIWRGVKQFDGVALQGSVGASYNAISFGLWYSSVNFGADSPFFETDPFIEVALPTGPVASAVGATLYTYDFSEFNNEADYEYEIYAKAGYHLFEIAAFYMPAQESLTNDIMNSAYWLSVSATKNMALIDFTLVLENGTYSGRFLDVPQKDPVSLFMFGLSRPLYDTFSIAWNYSLGLTNGLDNSLWINLGIDF